MTDLEIRIAIAEAQGHRWSANEPNPLEDLNACREAWLSLTYNQQAEFGHWLSVVVFGKGMADGMLFGEHDLASLANAKAPQRCEAFLRTIGKWKAQ